LVSQRGDAACGEPGRQGLEESVLHSGAGAMGQDETGLRV
jgi:hypothetical protein